MTPKAQYMKARIVDLILILAILLAPSCCLAKSSSADIDEFLYNSVNFQFQELQKYLDQFAEDHPHNPIVENGRVLLLLDPSTLGKSVQGDFNSWGRYSEQADRHANGHMQSRSLGETGWRYLLTSANNNAGLQYALADSDGQLSRDPRNPSVIISFGQAVSEILMPGFGQEMPDSRQRVTPGSLETFHLTTEFDQKTRKIQVYLPPAYDPNTDSAYPTV